ncbi:hypothetical protein PoB_007349800 [Plakobranchus ocellatus]|uniref:Uncharacterized protein n=1 Tax=Plakobranchus ocellatus TaxID=259542 RepID=A0AAV4DRM9_9GAST|nr:hypothetical protein PoB_007349800 [Plakobranchus ocellatus]
MAPPFPLCNRATDIRPGCKTQRIAPTLRQDESRSRLGLLSHQRNRVFSNMYCWTLALLPPVWARPNAVDKTPPELFWPLYLKRRTLKSNLRPLNCCLYHRPTDFTGVLPRSRRKTEDEHQEEEQKIAQP